MLDWLVDALNWLKDLLLWLPLKLYSLFLGGLAAFVELIPVPDWMANLNFSGIPPELVYFGAAFQIPLAFTCIIGGSVIRFLIRRLPVIG